MRAVLLLVTLAGCDLVLGLERRDERADGGPDGNAFESTTHDEDGDGIADAFDPCPHRAGTGDRDSDGDGIGDDCDPRPEKPDARYFFAFANGDTRRLRVTGVVRDAGDSAIVLGTSDEALSSLVVEGVATNVADIEVDATVIASDRDRTVPLGPYSEIGLASSHRSHAAGDAERGDICFAGHDLNSPPNYLEFDDDETDLDALTKRYSGVLTGVRMTVEHHATSAGFDCRIARPGETIANAYVRATPRTEVGSVAIDAVRLEAELHYLWVVVPR